MEAVNILIEVRGYCFEFRLQSVQGRYTVDKQGFWGNSLASFIRA